MACTVTKDPEKTEGISVKVPPYSDYDQVRKLATMVRPSYRQLDYQKREMIGFIHIGMNTFTSREWGSGDEDPEIFNPSGLDAEEWVKIFKNAGITAVILVAKHHDGFCVWPSNYTDHTVACSPWREGKGDLVREVSEACHRHDMKFCIYLSPWDMHESTYGTDAYNDYYVHQIEELLTGYGPVYMLWFDGAGVDSRVSGKEMLFNWNRIFTCARDLQPDILLSGAAPDIRWVGNEAGRGRETEWSVQGINDENELFGGLLRGVDLMAKNLGSIENLMDKKRLVWYPSRGGLPLRKGWFYSPADDHTTKSLEYLVDSYFSTVGQNSNLLPNLSPDTKGQIPQKDADRLIRFGKIIKEMKEVDFAKGAMIEAFSGWETTDDPSVLTDDDPFTSLHTPENVTQAVIEISLPKPEKINVIKLQENVRDYGQRVEAFAIDAKLEGQWQEIAHSTTVGFRKMVRLKEPVYTDSFRIRFLNARLSVSFGNVSLYYLAPLPEEQETPEWEKKPLEPLDKSNFTVKTTGIGKSDRMDKMIDHDPQTVFRGITEKEEAAIIICLDKEQEVKALSYLPDPSNDAGHIENYAVYVSRDGENWGTPISSGRFGNIENNPVEQYIEFHLVKARFLKLEIVKATKGHIGIAEISLY
jgi:alpha-L-fucosidase